MEKILEKVSGNLSVEIIPDGKFEFLMSTSEVAKGFGVSGGTIRSHKMEHHEELIEGKHFIAGVGKTNAFGKQAVATYWTKRGIIRLGFFIKSERAKMFRDWAEDLVINKIEETQQKQQQMQQLSIWPEPTKRNHNRLTKERLVDILADVAQIEDKHIRLSLVNKLTNLKHN